MKHVVRILLAIGFLFIVGLVPATTFAHNGENHSSDREARQHESTTLQGGESRLDENKRQACEARAENVKALMTRSVFRAENYGKLLATITERTKNFANTLDLNADAQGRTEQHFVEKLAVAQTNYDADFTALKAAAVFSCDGDNPKAQIIAFQEAHRTVMKDIKDWRTALRDFVSFLKDSSGAER